MKRFAGALIALLTLSLLAACAIEPGAVEVRDRPVNSIAGNPASKPDLARHDVHYEKDKAVELVLRFLEVSADDRKTRLETLRSYLFHGETWSGGSVLNVVHVLDPPPEAIQDADGIKVPVRVQHIGLLNEARGTIEPSTKGVETIDFIAVNVPGEGLLLRPPRVELLLSDSGLLGNFEARPVYSWDTSVSVLVPDLRYLPKYLPEATKANQLVEWLYQPPVSWLDATLHKIPQATKPADRVTISDDRSVVVNLNTQPNADELELIAEQMRKTLVVGAVSRLQLKVQNRLVAEKQAENEDRPRLSRYAVVKGVVYRLRPPGTASGNENHSPVALPEVANKSVAAVAFARHEAAAMVVHDTADGPRLSIVNGAGQIIPVALPGLLRPHRINQPAWLAGRATTGLVLAEETLYQVTSDGQATKITQVDGLTDMSVSPDGRRIALVVNGQLLVAALVQADKTLALGQYEANVPTLLSTVHAVAFGSPLELVVAGRDDKAGRILTMNLDGTAQRVGKGNPLAGNVFHLVSDGFSSNAMYEAAGPGAYQYGFSTSEELVNKIIYSGLASPPATLNSDVHAPSFEG
jgi:Lipoprotein LpqB beta-propeller domain